LNPLIRSVLILTVIENISTALVEHGTFFYMHGERSFGAFANLALGVGSGLAYMLGAAISHGLSQRFGERRVLHASLLGQALPASAMMLLSMPAALEHGLVTSAQLSWAMSLLFCIVSFSIGVKWPVIESYMAAGQTPKESAGSVGWFNLSWSGAVVPAVAVAGLLLHWWAPSVFAIQVITSIVGVCIVLRWPCRPVHLDANHPERPDAATLGRYKHLLVSSRWQMFTSYSLYFVMVPLFPIIFAELGVAVTLATVLASLVALSRFLTFGLLHCFRGWHGSATLLWASLVITPISAWAVLAVDSLPVILIAQIVFGWTAGVSYFSALYYALVIHNAEVEAGGDHEAVIGAGFVAGPMVGLGAAQLSKVLASPILGMTLGLLPLAAMGSFASAKPLARLLQQDHKEGLATDEHG
jgi:MFS family permease